MTKDPLNLDLPVLKTELQIEDLQNFYKKIQLCSTTESKKYTDILVSIINTKDSTKHCNRLILELAYKIYYKLLESSNNEDVHFYPKLKNLNLIEKSLILQGILESNYFKRCQYSDIKEFCLNTFCESIKNTSRITLISLKNLNLLYKKYSISDLNFPIEYLYHYLQSNVTGVRDETIQLITNYTKNFHIACKYMNIIINYWPWTNRMKFYFLSAILSNYQFSYFIDHIPDLNEKAFFNGIQFSLSCKSLFSPGQTLVRTLDKHYQAIELRNMICRIIEEGTLQELINLSTQWMRYMTKKDEIFDDLNLKENWKVIKDNNNLKFPIICNIFISQLQKCEDLKEIIEYLMNSCFDYPIQIQIHIYWFISDNISVVKDNLFENSLNFILKFFKKHLDIPSPEIRQSISCKIPQLFDFLPKKYSKIINNQIIIKKFFKEIMLIIQNGINNKEYQPLIFCLKILEILIKILFISNQKRIIKNSNLQLNQKLAEILIKEDIYKIDNLKLQLFKILKCSETRYDDVQELIVNILKLINTNNFDEAFNLCKISNSESSIDICTLSSYYTKICLNSSHFNSKQNDFLNEFFNYCKNNILNIQNKIENDPLETCKNGNHLFGYMNSLNEFLLYNFKQINIEDILEIIELIEKIIQSVLRMFNEASNNTENCSPDFQIMDESLEIIINRSSIEVNNDCSSDEKKFLLLSFWMTLKACSDLSTTIGCNLSINIKDDDDDSIKINLIKRCLMINVKILSQCRHKGAIEAAGLSLGKLVKIITNHNLEKSKIYQILYSCFDVIFGNVKEISTTRRGAGFPIMFHHLLKNEANKDRPLFNHAINIILNYNEIKNYKIDSDDDDDEQHENFNALILHYLCVIVRDTELRENISEYFDDIMMAAIQKIEDNDWRVRNAALQLFGALVPKIVGQRQLLCTDYWEPIEFTFTDAFIKLPKTCEYILKYCSESNKKNISISSLILFLEFFSNVEYIQNYIDNNENLYWNQIQNFRIFFWRFLSHKYEKVRKLAARCISRIHDFHYELLNLIKCIIKCFFNNNNNNENFKHGILLCIIECIYKIKHDFKNITNNDKLNLNNDIRNYFLKYYKFNNYDFYLKSELIKFFKIIEFNFECQEILEILFSKKNFNKNDINKIIKEYNIKNIYNPGYEIWKENILEIYKINLI